MAMIQLDSRTWMNSPATANGVTTIDGYLFVGMSYIEAVTKWFELREKPDYKSNPPIMSISANVTVSGSVQEEVQPATDRSDEPDPESDSVTGKTTY